MNQETISNKLTGSSPGPLGNFKSSNCVMRSSSSVVAEDAPNLSLDVVDRCDFMLAAKMDDNI